MIGSTQKEKKAAIIYYVELVQLKHGIGLKRTEVKNRYGKLTEPIITELYKDLDDGTEIFLVKE
ncbi:MAG: hypothetical protein WC364_05815 [Eubacteriales bacterium]|jgi:hypothetical protein